MAHRDPTSNIPDPLPGRCLHCGCHRPRRPGDDLGLCRLHHNQLTHGTIGNDIDTSSREHTIAEAQALIDMIREALDLPEDVSIRRLARDAGPSKDLVWHITRANFTQVRSVAWETMQEVFANALYAKDQASHQPSKANAAAA